MHGTFSCLASDTGAARRPVCPSPRSQLDLSLNAWVDDHTIEACARAMPRLQTLLLEKTEVTDAAAVAIAESLSASLTHLDLSRTALRGAPAARGAIGSLVHLRTLLLAYTSVDAALVEHLPSRLTRLKLSRALAFDDAAIVALAGRLSQGTQLAKDEAPEHMGSGKRSSEEHTTECLRLTALDVGSPEITDACVAALVALANAGLQSLTLWHCRLTDAGCTRLREASGLQLDESMGTSSGTFLLRRPHPLTHGSGDAVI